MDVTKNKINGADAKCLKFGQPPTTYCVDSATSHLVSVDGELGTFEYSNYATFGNNAYPGTVKVSYVKTPMEDAKVTVTRGDQVPQKCCSILPGQEHDGGLRFLRGCGQELHRAAAPQVNGGAGAGGFRTESERSTANVWVLASGGQGRFGCRRPRRWGASPS